MPVRSMDNPTEEEHIESIAIDFLKATALNNLELVKSLYSQLESNDKSLALSLAINAGHLEVFKFLMAQKDTDVNYQDEDGNTPLHCAITTYELSEDNSIMFSLLINHPNINLNIQNRKGQTPLHLMSNSKMLRSMKLMIYKDARLDIKDKKGNTLLDIAEDRDTIKRIKTAHDIHLKNQKIINKD